VVWEEGMSVFNSSLPLACHSPFLFRPSFCCTETPGEAPFLSAAYAANFVSGMQEGEDPRYLQTSSCCKHWDAYDLEDWGGLNRYDFDAVVTQQDLFDTYMPAFQSCVSEGRASGVMCSYNAVNGIPSCADKLFNEGILREAWGFDGYITSDCGAVEVIMNNHHYTNTTDETCAVAMTAGTDLDCGSFYTSNLPSAVAAGSVTEEQVKTALSHLFSVRMRLGQFDPPEMQPYKSLPPSVVNSAAHQELALDAARQAIVLLKNTGATLPLDAKTIKTLAVVGPNANATTVMQGNYYGVAPYLVSPVAGLSKYASVTYVEGCSIAGNTTVGFDAAVDAASAADATVIVVGLDQTQEAEMNDRTIIWWPGVQGEFISRVAAAAKGPVVVVSLNGGPIDMSAEKTSTDVDAMLWAGYPGQSGGTAIAEILFGDSVPGGRLPYTIYPSSFITVSNVSMFNMNMRPNPAWNYPGRGYRFYTGEPVYPFGYGLSYTSFSVSWGVSPARTVSSGPILEFLEAYPTMQGAVAPTSASGRAATLTSFSVTVRNTGEVGGDYVALAYVVPPEAGVNGEPLKYLIGFERVFLEAGASASVFFPVTVRDLTRIDEGGARVASIGEHMLVVEGGGDEEALRLPLRVE
jgi:beta-glucosidase-like glycosyl hydrolase